MVTGKTSTGFEYSIKEGLTSDFRFVKAYRDYRSSNPEKQIDGVCDMISVVFSDEEQERRFYQHIADVYGGRVPTDKLLIEVNEIIAQFGDETKN